MKPIISALIALSALLALSACGSGSTPNEVTTTAGSAQSASISLTSDSERTTKTGIGPRNLLDLCSAPWPTWSGESTGIRCLTSSELLPGQTFSPHGVLLIPAPADDKKMTIGVRRYDQTLVEGFSYTLSVSADNGAAAILFLFDSSGALVPVPGVDGLAVAQQGTSISFQAPADIAGFYLQVQSAWEATGDDVIAPYVPEPVTAGGLFEAERPWTDWEGNAVSGIGYNNLVGHTAISAPDAGQSLRYGIQRYNVGLVEGQRYDLSIRTARGEAWLLLFMLDADGQLIPEQPGSGWALAIGREGDDAGVWRITAPAGVASYVIQIQGKYNATESAFAYPKLEQVDSIASR